MRQFLDIPSGFILMTIFKPEDYGFTYGAATITRIHSDDKRGWVVLYITTPKSKFEVYVTKTGKTTIREVKNHVSRILK